MNQQEIIYKLSFLEQKTKYLQEQLQAVEQGIVELSILDFGLEELKDSKGKEIFSELGRGIFVKSKIVSDKVIVDVGSKNFVEKTIPDTKFIIKEQIKNLESAKNDIENEIKNLQNEMLSLVDEIQKDGIKKRDIL